MAKGGGGGAGGSGGRAAEQPAASGSRFAGRSREDLEGFRQMYTDNIASRVSRGQTVPNEWRMGLAEVEQLLAGERPQVGAVASAQVFGHPQATNIGGGKYSNLVPITVGSADRLVGYESRAQELLNELQTRTGLAEVAGRLPAKQVRTAEQRRLRTYLRSAAFDEDVTVRDLLRNETLPELRRMRRALAGD